MKVLLIGASGLIGRVVLKRSTHRILAPTHSELDVSNYYKVEQYFKDRQDIDAVVHCAVAKPDYYEDTERWGAKVKEDVAMATNLVRFAKRLVILTSGSIMHDTEVSYPKRVISSICQSFPNILELRPYGIYGPGERQDRLPTYCFRRIAENRPEGEIPLVALRENRLMSYIYVDDMADIIDHFLDTDVTGIMDVADPIPNTIGGIATLCAEVANKEVLVAYDNQGIDYIANTDRLILEWPEWQATPFKKGLMNLYETCSL